MRGSRMFCQRKSNSTDTFLLDEWSEESAQQQNAGGARNTGLVAFNFPGDLDQYC